MKPVVLPRGRSFHNYQWDRPTKGTLIGWQGDKLLMAAAAPTSSTTVLGDISLANPRAIFSSASDIKYRAMFYDLDARDWRSTVCDTYDEAVAWVSVQLELYLSTLGGP